MKRFAICILVTFVVLGICIGMCSCGKTGPVRQEESIGGGLGECQINDPEDLSEEFVKAHSMSSNFNEARSAFKGSINNIGNLVGGYKSGQISEKDFSKGTMSNIFHILLNYDGYLGSLQYNSERDPSYDKFYEEYKSLNGRVKVDDSNVSFNETIDLLNDVCKFLYGVPYFKSEESDEVKESMDSDPTASESGNYQVKPVEFSDDIFGDSPVTESQVLVNGLRKLFTNSCKYINQVINSEIGELLPGEFISITQNISLEFVRFNMSCRDEFDNLSDQTARAKYDKIYKKFVAKTDSTHAYYTGDFADIVDFIDQFHEFIFGKELLNNSQRLEIARKVLEV